jgi:hypothetical protein
LLEPPQVEVRDLPPGVLVPLEAEHLACVDVGGEGVFHTGESNMWANLWSTVRESNGCAKGWIPPNGATPVGRFDVRCR